MNKYLYRKKQILLSKLFIVIIMQAILAFW